jgi:hypothetical protein
MSFDTSLASVPRHFAYDGDIVASHVAACLSAVFPDGEDYFVRSVRRFRDQVKGSSLEHPVNGFIGQEAVHGREHRAFNRRLSELGYPTRLIERLTERGLALADKVLSPKVNLAATAAAEHYTATLAELLLAEDGFRHLFGDQRVLDLFLWHALEEAEHKAVAFDVYRAVGGSERMRRRVMTGMNIGFIGGITVAVLVSLAGDPAAYNPLRLIPSVVRFLRSPVISRKVWRAIREYAREGFHPDDHDAVELLAAWREQLFGTDGSLKDRMAGVA